MAFNIEGLQALIERELKPIVKKVDEEAFYAENFLYALGKDGFFNSANKSEANYLLDELTVVNETAKVCMTTAFCVWCHLAALTYLRKSKNDYLRAMILPKFENGELLGATGLSNPMKFYAGLEKLQLRAEKVDGGYVVNGILAAVSNLGKNHWFGVLAGVGDEEVMMLVSTEQEGLELKEKVQFVGVNGSATYSCRFMNVFIPNEQVIAEKARSFIDEIRPTFILYQIPLGLGVMSSAADGMDKVRAKQNNCNDFLPIHSTHLRNSVRVMTQKIEEIVIGNELTCERIVHVRLQAVHDTLQAVQANMIHNGAGGYVEGSVAYRKLREAYFFANLTPTVRQLEKMAAKFAATEK